MKLKFGQHTVVLSPALFLLAQPVWARGDVEHLLVPLTPKRKRSIWVHLKNWFPNESVSNAQLYTTIKHISLSKLKAFGNAMQAVEATVIANFQATTFEVDEHWLEEEGYGIWALNKSEFQAWAGRHFRSKGGYEVSLQNFARAAADLECHPPRDLERLANSGVLFVRAVPLREDAESFFLFPKRTEVGKVVWFAKPEDTAEFHEDLTVSFLRAVGPNALAKLSQVGRALHLPLSFERVAKVEQALRVGSEQDVRDVVRALRDDDTE